jgi:hypothetical protein
VGASAARGTRRPVRSERFASSEAPIVTNVGVRGSLQFGGLCLIQLAACSGADVAPRDLAETVGAAVPADRSAREITEEPAAPAASDGSVDGLRGAMCAYGTYGCNACIPDVPARFESASGSHEMRHHFYFDPGELAENGPTPDAYSIDDHIQSVARIPGLGDENWVALSRSARDAGDGAFYLTSFGHISSNGDAWKWAAQRTTSHPTAKSYAYYRVAGVNHAGGMQALGPMLYVAVDCDAGNNCLGGVDVYDVRSPNQVVLLDQFRMDGSQGELLRSDGALSSRAAAVGAVKLESGQTLMFVRGREPENNGWFFRSVESTIETGTHWELIGAWRSSDLPSDTPWYPWENVNLVTDCNDRAIYAVAMGTLENKSFLYRVVPAVGTEAGLNFQFVGSRGLNTSGPLTSTRFGAGVHVTPNGNLVSYVTDRQPELEIEEFRYHGTHGN